MSAFRSAVPRGRTLPASDRPARINDMPSRVRAPENRGGICASGRGAFLGPRRDRLAYRGEIRCREKIEKAWIGVVAPVPGGEIRPRAAGGGYDVRSQPSGCMMNSSHLSSQRVSGQSATREVSLRTGACRRPLPFPCRSASDVPSAFHARQVAHCLNGSTTFTHGDPSFRYQP